MLGGPSSHCEDGETEVQQVAAAATDTDGGMEGPLGEGESSAVWSLGRAGAPDLPRPSASRQRGVCAVAHYSPCQGIPTLGRGAGGPFSHFGA